MQYEKRFLTDEIRASEDSGIITGYAARFNSPSRDLGGFVEVIERGAFKRTLQEDAQDVLALVEHDPSKVLASIRAGTLTLEEDERGLRFELTPADTTYARDLLELVRTGNVAGASFRFAPHAGGARMDMSTSPVPTRTLTSVRLKEVSVVTSWPAYPDTSVAMRDLERAQDEARKNIVRRMRMRLRLAEAE